MTSWRRSMECTMKGWMAHLLDLQAVALDPSNLGYRLNTAATLQESDRYQDAIHVLQASAGIARSPEEAATVDGRLKALQQYQAQREQAAEPNKQSQGQAPARPKYTGDKS